LSNSPFLLDKVIEQVLLDNREVTNELSNNHLDVQSEFSCKIDSNRDIDQAKSLDMRIDLCKD